MAAIAGYFAGGTTSGGHVATADKLVFSTDTTAAQTSANISSDRWGPAGCASSTNGYFAGGFVVTTADKLIFNTDVTAAQTSANLSQARYHLAGINHHSVNTITSGNIASGQIGQFHLSSGAINSGHISSGVLTTYSMNCMYEDFITAEIVSGTRAVCMTSGNAVAVAMGASGLRMPAIGVNENNALSGTIIRVIMMGKLNVPAGQQSLWSGQAGRMVYASTSGFQITATRPAVGTITQRIGIAMSGGILVDHDLAVSSGSAAANLSGGM